MSAAAENAFDPEGFNAPARSEREFLRQYVPQDDDEGVIAHFERVKEHQPFESKQKGEDIYRDVDYVRIRVRGNDKLEVHRRASEEDKRRFPYAWQQYRLGKEQSARGTPLDDLGINGASIAQYHAKNIFTVEDFALVDDGNLQHLPAGSREYRKKARDLVELKRQAGSSGEMDALRAQNAQLAAQNAQAMEQNSKLAAQVQRLLDRLDASETKPATPRKAKAQAQPQEPASS
jgi:hypothetical protein